MARKKELIFINNEFGSISRTDFRRPKKAEKFEFMEAWFRHRYEDPVHRTPYESAEGGYQYIYGGPYDAREQLGEQFYDLVPESLIDEVANELENESYLWTETPKPEDYGADEDELFVGLGSNDEGKFRAEVVRRLERLESALADRPNSRGLLGHNNPPEPLDEIADADLDELAVAAATIRAELSKAEPDVVSVIAAERVTVRFSERLQASLMRKLDLATDEFAKKIGEQAASIPFWYGVYEALHNFLPLFAAWIRAVLGG